MGETRLGSFARPILGKKKETYCEGTLTHPARRRAQGRRQGFAPLYSPFQQKIIALGYGFPVHKEAAGSELCLFFFFPDDGVNPRSLTPPKF